MAQLVLLCLGTEKWRFPYVQGQGSVGPLVSRVRAKFARTVSRVRAELMFLCLGSEQSWLSGVKEEPPTSRIREHLAHLYTGLWQSVSH